MTDPQPPETPNDPTGMPAGESAPTDPTRPMPATPPNVPPTDPNVAVPAGPDPRWYENRGAVAAIIAVGLIAVFLLVGWLVLWSGDDDDDAAQSTIGTALIVDGSTIPTDVTSTFPPPSIVEVTPEPTIKVTLPPETTAPPTTVAPTTVATTTAPTTTATTPAPTTTVPVVVVPADGSIWDIIATNDDLSRARELVEIVGLEETLTTTDPLTVFIPTNAAIEAYEATGADLTSPEVVATLLFAHSTPQRLDAAAVLASTEIETIGNDPLIVDQANGTINGANLVLTDVEGTNGFLHVVDMVLTP